MIHNPIKFDSRAMAAVLLFCLTVSCNKFLSIQPKGVQTLQSVNDFDLWLNAEELFRFAGDSYDMDVMTDYTDNTFLAVPNNQPAGLMFTWAPQFTLELSQGADAEAWDIIYHRIYYYNAVIKHINAATNGTSDQKNELMAESLLGRANEYFLLTNLYAQPYNSATSSNDLSVPFVTDDDITAATPPRSMSVSAMYAKIISDINTAIPNLVVFNPTNRTRGSQLAAFSVLARVYLYMNDYANAAKYAAMAIDNSNISMINYSNTQPSSLPVLPSLTDAIYARTFSDQIQCDLTFLKSYDLNDLRLTYFLSLQDPSVIDTAQRGTIIFLPTNSGNSYYNAGTSMGEMLLIEAENAARTNNLNTALNYLNQVRVNRFSDSNYTPLSSTDQLEVLNWVIRERGYEMPYGGMRWLDMRRLDQQGLMPTVNHSNLGGTITASLPPHSPRYTLQIPNSILKYNPDMPQNP